MWNLNEAEKTRPGEYEKVTMIFTPDMAAGETALLDVAARLGLDTSGMRLVPDGEIRRCPEAGRGKHDDAGWYVSREFKGVIYGTAGNWRSDEWVSWASRPDDALTDEFKRERKIREQQDRASIREVQREKGQAVAAQLLNLPPASDDHPYLKAKGVRAHGLLRQGDLLVVPVRDIDGTVISRQTIDAKGDKSFAYQCAGTGMHVIGAPTDHVVIAEGYATGASIHEATGLRVYVVFNAGNIKKMAPEIAAREAESGATVVIAADHDRPDKTSGKRAGIEAAQAAAAEIQCEVLLPRVEGEDWNDVALRDRRELVDAFKRLQQLFPDWVPVPAGQLRARQWVYGRHYIRRYLSLTVAPGGVGKSLLVMTEAIAIATGRNLLGVDPGPRRRVCYYNAEDPMDELNLRIAAICAHHGIPQEELTGWFFPDSGRRADPVIIARGTPAVPHMQTLTRLKMIIRRRRADVLILDPLANMHDAEETNEAYRTMLRPLLEIAEDEGIALEVVHHTTKLYGNEAKVENSRGGSSLLGAARVARAINNMSEEEARDLGVTESRRFLFRVDPDGKNNLSPQATDATWFRRVPIHLQCEGGEIESVASVEQWTPPDPSKRLTAHMAVEARRLIEDMEPKPGPRQVLEVIAEAIGGEADEALCKFALKRWLATGVLEKRQEHDSRQGRAMSKIYPGPRDPEEGAGR